MGVAAPAPATGAGSEGDAGERIGDGATPAAGLGRSPSQGSQPQGVHQAAADRAGPEAAGWEGEAEARRLWQREEAALYQFRRADVTARGRRSQADGRQAVVTREEAGLRLAEELSEDRLLVARETLELSVARQAERQHVLERRKAAARTTEEREELAVLRRNEACLRSLRGFDEAAEAEDERGRRRLWVEYRRGGTASEGRGRHHVIGGYADGGAGEDGRPKWRSVSLQGCPREVRLLLAGPYYFDVDMVNSLPNVARQLGRRGMVREASLRALSELCSKRDSVLKDIVEYYGLVDAAAQGVTARDRAKDLPIRILHGGGHAAWLAAQGLQESSPALPLVAQLERELRDCRHEVYAYVQRHDAAWLRGVEDHVRGAEARRPGERAVAGPRAATAAAAREKRLREKMEASVFARWLQDVEDGCLGCVRRVLQAEGWPARSWQQDGLLVEDEGGRRLREGACATWALGRGDKLRTHG